MMCQSVVQGSANGRSNRKADLSANFDNVPDTKV